MKRISRFRLAGARRLRPATDGEENPRAARRRRGAYFVLGKAPVKPSVPFDVPIAGGDAEIRFVEADLLTTDGNRFRRP